MTAEEAAYIMMSGGLGGNIQPYINIDTYGIYTRHPDDGYDGIGEVRVNLPDRYQDGYDNGYEQGKEDGREEGRASVKIVPLTVTENGVYDATQPPYNADAFQTVTANVPDQYDDGYTNGKRDGYAEAMGLIFPPITPTPYILQIDFRIGKNKYYPKQWIMDARVVDENGNVMTSQRTSAQGSDYTKLYDAEIIGISFIPTATYTQIFIQFRVLDRPTVIFTCRMNNAPFNCVPEHTSVEYVEFVSVEENQK